MNNCYHLPVRKQESTKHIIGKKHTSPPQSMTESWIATLSEKKSKHPCKTTVRNVLVERTAIDGPLRLSNPSLEFTQNTTDDLERCHDSSSESKTREAALLQLHRWH